MINKKNMMVEFKNYKYLVSNKLYINIFSKRAIIFINKNIRQLEQIRL